MSIGSMIFFFIFRLKRTFKPDCYVILALLIQEAENLNDDDRDHNYLVDKIVSAKKYDSAEWAILQAELDRKKPENKEVSGTIVVEETLTITQFLNENTN